MHQFSQHKKRRDLVSIRRSEIDDNAIQGFVLAASAELVVLQYVYDFNLDGLMVLRIADITDVRCTATDKFQKGQAGTNYVNVYQRHFERNASSR